MLKLILLIVIVLAVLWLARAGRRRVNPPAARPGPGAPSAREAMVSCTQCGLHLPKIFRKRPNSTARYRSVHVGHIIHVSEKSPLLFRHG